MSRIWRAMLLGALSAVGACESSPVVPEEPPTRPHQPARNGTGDVCFWIGYGAGYLCPGIVAVSSPYTPPDPPYGGAMYSSPCTNSAYTCTYDPNLWLASGTYSENGGAPEGFPYELYAQLNSRERQLVWAHPLQGIRVYVARRDAERWPRCSGRRARTTGSRTRSGTRCGTA